MAKPAPKITLHPSRDIPLDCLVLSQSNVRRVKAGVSIDKLADSIARRGLLQSLYVRPILDPEGQETGRYEIPAGGRRFRALELLAKQKRLAKDAPIPCVVRAAANDILAEEDSLVENSEREQLHPLDEFRGMKAMVDKGNGVEEIAARFHTTAAAVRQRLKLAGVSPKLHDIYADEAMTLDQLMAFTVSDDHARQEEVWDQLEHSFRTPAHIRQKLTENSVRAQDKRVRFVGIDDYVAAGGAVVRDLFESDHGGWLTDPALLDRLVEAKLGEAGEGVAAEGWKWVAIAIDLPWEATRGLREIIGEETPMTAEEEARVAELEAEGEELGDEWGDANDVPDEIHARIEAIDNELAALAHRPCTFDSAELAIAGAFVTLDSDGRIRVERGYVKPEDEPASDEEETDEPGETGDAAPAGDEAKAGEEAAAATAEEEAEEGLKPLPDRLVADLTAWRTLALQDAFAQDPATAYVAVLHAFVLGCFFSHSRDNCVQISAHRTYFGSAGSALRDSSPGQAITARGAAWRERLPDSDKDVWDFLLTLGADEQAQLLAHCVSGAVNAHAEIVPKHGGGQVSAHMVERRIAHSNVLARAVGLNLVDAGWRPTVASYFQGVTKPRILADVTEARGEQFVQMIDHLKKGDMAREAERLLEETGWLPEPLRTPGLDDIEPATTEGEEPTVELPAFLADDPADEDGESDAELPVAAE
ncbi:MAG: ParB/RepB/Spo0J family partition protein [Sphingopyxis sp.]|uniref:ParB/RepB/Spo0J family partition protein n=1 Tax=Sphingopyxis sp. TaxID=1908224 RepID=UPI001A2379FA|nr:ParB/RepB/Spo0J family partition protein [Sphingopyxis sp.]MBJ7500892.1 ParB/RepB/Spo0J family partition protein [Sphingopyxis sp.]